MEQVAEPAVVGLKLAMHPVAHEVPEAEPTIASELHSPTPVFDPKLIAVMAAAAVISQTLLLAVHVPDVNSQTPAVAGSVYTYAADPVLVAVAALVGVHLVVEPD